MNTLNFSAEQIAIEMGEKIRKLRIQNELTQKELASRAQLSLKALCNLESGKSNLHTFIAVLRCIDQELIESIDKILTPNIISPMDLLKHGKVERKRVGTPRKSKGNP